MTTIHSTRGSTANLKENGVKAAFQRHPLFAMYALMFILAWSVMIPQALYSQGIIAAPLPMALELLVGWAPAISAVTVSAIIAGKAGVSSLLRRLLIWKVGVQYYLVALFLLAAVILGGVGLNSLLGGGPAPIPAAGSPAFNVAVSFLLLIALGVLFNTEEIAWRGFALTRLQARYKVLVAGLLLAIPEVLLHLPNFWIKENPFYHNVGMLWFSAFSVAAVFIYTFIFNKTRGSLLIVTLLHASQNAWANLLSDNTARPFYYTVAIMWMIALALILATRGQLGHEQE